ncbi:Queuine/archaeosine tRNA-ribosyltransferase [Halapricum desulfuricans]|uniref:tRNA-guanine(15) transglycosylase n=2 Tax=Halapricum desulfuricans TaxID=2841257 RepID=A0A897N797_9EURY|nr:Queuine/archaeosine tRNA-ribosyltransferase [Halapricum desulfuricans]
MTYSPERRTMRDAFEVRTYDGAARIGELRVPRADVTVETPALMPVVNPHVQTIEPARLESAFGAEIMITNSYILHGSDDLREDALQQGLHDLLGFSGAIVTDSGSFQLAEYGEIDVTTTEILEFQREIGSDVGTPVDIPTPPDVGREQAERELATTQERLETAESVDTGEMLVNAPIQGSTYRDLRTEAAEHAYGTGLDVFPIGAVVPLLNSYRYADITEIVGAVKRGLGGDAPVHLFGAGHPMMFALAVAMGCDLFDSAAYALYARDERYLTVRGTEHLDELEYFPCECPVCSEHTPEELREMDDDRAERLLAEHNLHVSFGEMRRVKQAIRRGNLLELVETRARNHPTMLDGYRALLDDADRLEASDPATKDAFFHVSTESARRPEVRRHHRRLERFDLDGEILLASDRDALDRSFDERWSVTPPFGPYPPALAEAYPLTAEVPERFERQAYAAAGEGIRRLVEANPGATFTVALWDWPEGVLAALPDGVERADGFRA